MISLEHLPPLKNSTLAEVLKSGAAAALEAGKAILNLYDKPHDIKNKGDIDLVTEADVAAEAIIIEILAESHPDVKVLAEESHSEYSTFPSGKVWIIDPLDGTTNFAHNFPWFAVSIAYAEDQQVKAGIIYNPKTDELFCAAKGEGAWMNGIPIKVSDVCSLDKALMATGFPYDIRQDPDAVINAMKDILTKVQGVRRAGAAAMDLAYVACGRLDGFWEIKLKPWDTSAGLILIKEAGGKVSDFNGSQYSPFLPEITASNGLLHDKLVALLKNYSTNKTCR